MNQSSFSSLKLNPDLLNNLSSLGYTVMTPIQEQSIPPILAGKDVIGQGKTGSGKTAAFGLGLLQKLNVKDFRVQGLVICPTRELADQVAKNIRKLARSIHNIKVITLCGGTPLRPQADSIENGCHIIVGTPGRIEDHLTKRTLNLNTVKTLILDEADRMLDMGFQSVLDFIIEQIPKHRQTLLFSATYPEEIQSITKRIMINPVMTKVESIHDNTSIRQHFYRVEDDAHRLRALCVLLKHFEPESALVFCKTKIETQEIASELADFGFSALALHGDLGQRDRDETLGRFSNKSVSVLVATDVAARGLDIDALSAVINYRIAHDAEMHVHRIGRTGRAGSKGVAYTLFSERESQKLTFLNNNIDPNKMSKPLPSIKLIDKPIQKPTKVTLQIAGGKKQKLRPGDIVGALTGDKIIGGKQVGNIQIFDHWALVAVDREVAQVALKTLTDGRLKGRNFRVRLLSDEMS